ncbi:MAG: PTS sugar transporter subunit IIA [Planctomycetaceae bacterium]
MQFNIGDVARLFQVTEGTVIRWVQDENLPAELVDSEYRFDRTELLEWAVLKKMRFSPAMFDQVNGGAVREWSVADALMRGGISYRVRGGDRRSALRSVVDGLPLPASFDKDTLLQLFLARERLGTTAIGDGIAIPHPRVPVVLPVGAPLIHLALLDKGVDFGAPDGRPVTTVFAMVCPTVHDHLQLLAKLSLVLQDSRTRNVIAQHSSEDAILGAIGTTNDAMRHAEVVEGRA